MMRQVSTALFTSDDPDYVCLKLNSGVEGQSCLEVSCKNVNIFVMYPHFLLWGLEKHRG